MLPIFFIVTFGLFWLTTPLANALLVGFIGSFSPSVTAIVLTAVSSGGAGVQALLARLGIRRVSAAWYAAALGIPLAASLAVFGASSLMSGGRPIQAGPALALMPIIYLLAAGEELGWRGFALPRLLVRLEALPAALLLGVIHALYHLPLWLAPGFPAPSYSFASFVVASLAFGILWTWLYQHTGGSVLISTLFHGTINAAGNLLFGGVPLAQLTWLMPAAFGAAAILVLCLAGPDLSRRRVASAAAGRG